jgi:hypothetical protein
MGEKAGRPQAERLRPVFRQHPRDEGDEHEELARLWGVAVCACCGRTILLGESTRHTVVDGRRADLCEACAPGALRGGRRNAA